MNVIKFIGIFGITLVGLCTASKAQLLIDVFSEVDPTSSDEWSNAGVVEDLSAAAAGTNNGYNRMFNISGGLTVSRTSGISGSGGSAFPDNNMLKDYAFSSNSISFSFGGFESGGFANTLTTTDNIIGLIGNEFTLEADTAYRLYLFGAGDDDGQNAAFTFDGVTKTTSPLIVGTAEDADHFVTFDFVTESDLTGFTLDFTVDRADSKYAIINGLALVAIKSSETVSIPEPSSYVVLFGLFALTGVSVRRINK